MKDLSLHLLDILENAATAGATQISVHLWFAGDVFWFEVADNGPGLPAAVADDPTNPYRTTRTERPVGLGLALLRAAAEQTGGSLAVRSRPGQGVTVRASFPCRHLDAKPLGDVAGALLTAALGWPADLQVMVGTPPEPVLDMLAVRRELAGLPLSHPDVSRFLRQTLESGLAPLQERAERVFGSGVGPGPAVPDRQRPGPATAAPGGNGVHGQERRSPRREEP